MNSLVMDTGYKFRTTKGTHLFLHKVYEQDVEGVNFFIDDNRDPCGIVILRFKGLADISGLDTLAKHLEGERMYLPRDWRVQFVDYEMVFIECIE